MYFLNINTRKLQKKATTTSERMKPLRVGIEFVRVLSLILPEDPALAEIGSADQASQRRSRLPHSRSLYTRSVAHTHTRRSLTVFLVAKRVDYSSEDYEKHVLTSVCIVCVAAEN